MNETNKTAPLSADGLPVIPGDKVYSIVSGNEFTVNYISFRGWTEFYTGKSHSHWGSIIWYAKSKGYALREKLNRLLKEVNDAQQECQAKKREYHLCLNEIAGLTK